MGGEEGAQRLREELGQRIGVRQHPDLAGETAGIGAEVLPKPFGLRQHDARVLEKRAAGLGRRDAVARSHQERRTQRLLHVADAGARGSQREMGALGAVGNAAGLRDVPEQAEVGEIEAHDGSLRIIRREAYAKRILRPRYLSLIFRAMRSNSFPGACARAASGLRWRTCGRRCGGRSHPLGTLAKRQSAGA